MTLDLSIAPENGSRLLNCTRKRSPTSQFHAKTAPDFSIALENGLASLSCTCGNLSIVLADSRRLFNCSRKRHQTFNFTRKRSRFSQLQSKPASDLSIATENAASYLSITDGNGLGSLNFNRGFSKLQSKMVSDPEIALKSLHIMASGISIAFENGLDVSRISRLHSTTGSYLTIATENSLRPHQLHAKTVSDRLRLINCRRKRTDPEDPRDLCIVL
jgi:hypothetical protein